MKTKTYEQIAAQIYHRVEQGKKVDDDYLVNITDSIKEQENLQDYKLQPAASNGVLIGITQ